MMKEDRRGRRRLLLLSLLFQHARAFYLPGSAPRDFVAGDSVPVYVNALSPQAVHKSDSEVQLKALVSYDYYDPGFGFCKPTEPLQKQSESLGAAFMGDRLYNSPFDIRMKQNVTCSKLCTTTMSGDAASFIDERIRESYSINWLVDGLPAAEMKRDNADGQLFYSPGFELGSVVGKTGQKTITTVNNHYDIYLDYHPRDRLHNRLVGVVVYPSSRDSLASATGTGGTPDCSTERPFIVHPGSSRQIAYTYSVYWRESATPWATRWDMYLKVLDPRIHVLSLINSAVIAFFLCGLVAMIMLRALHRDISRYNAVDFEEDVLQEDYGWKLVHGEVFRPPRKRMILAVLVGSGAQLAAMFAVTLVFALLGFLSPSSRGALSTVMLVSWALFGCVSGYVSSRLFVTLRGEQWRKNIAITALGPPTLMFLFLFLLNFFLIGARSSGAVPFGTFVVIVILFFLINVPLNVAGALYGLKKGPISNPARVNNIPRQIPPSPVWLKPWPSAVIAGLLPFAASFLETYFILSSYFGSKVYYAFGFLALTSIVIAVTTATTTVLLCYFHLAHEDYRWHWRAFFAGGGSAIWLVAYGLFYWMTRLKLEGVANKVLFLGYLLLTGGIAWLVTGTVGFLSCYAFLRLIYSRIRID